MRIVSLVPSLSETVCDLGLRAALVGCTNFCIAPRDLHRSATRIGGTKDPNLTLIRSLHPTHILANQEENPREPVLELAQDLPVLVTFPKGPQDVPAMLRALGGFLGTDAAEAWAADIENLLQKKSRAQPLRFLYLIWQNPYMAAGADTYISRTLETLGWVNVCSEGVRYPEIPIEGFAGLGADIILLSSEPYPFRRRDAEKLKALWPSAPRLARVDGQLLSWFGTRTREALRLLGEGEAGWLKDF